MGSKKALISDATAPFVSQLAFSVVSFFSVAGLARQASELQLASVIAAYSLESIALSWANARWASLLVFREALQPRRGDIAILTKAFVVVTAISFPILFGAAVLVDRSWSFALMGAVWSCCMLIGDLYRYAGSRFLGIKSIGTIGLAHALVAVTVTFLPITSPVRYLAILSMLSLLAGAAYHVALAKGRKPGASTAWTQHKKFGQSMGQEAVLTSGATGLGGAAVSWLNPGLAVGLQLGNQILGMPATVLAQSFALPLSRKLREWMDGGSYPRKLLLGWSAFALAVPVVGLVALYLVEPLISLLLGDRASTAYYYLPVVFLQAVMILPWQPFTMARRWTHGADNPRRHVVVTVALFYLTLVGIALLDLDDSQTRLWLVLAGGVLVASTLGRGILWWRDGPSWSGIEPGTRTGRRLRSVTAAMEDSFTPDPPRRAMETDDEA